MAARREREYDDGFDAEPGPLETAVRLDIDALEVIGPLARSLSETAYNLARKLDTGAGMATAAVAHELRETLQSIAEASGDDDGAAFFAQMSTPVLNPPKP